MRNAANPWLMLAPVSTSQRLPATTDNQAKPPKKHRYLPLISHVITPAISTRYPQPEKPRQKRAVIQDMVRPLKQWLLRHRHNPYPTKAEKVELADGSNMTLVQVQEGHE